MIKTKTRIEQQSERKSNQQLVETIRAAKKTGDKFWLQVASIISSPRRAKIAVNLNDIEKETKEGDSIVIPGKILSQGEISKKVALISLGISEKAKEKLLKTKSQSVSMIDEIKKNPQAKGLRMIK